MKKQILYKLVVSIVAFFCLSACMRLEATIQVCPGKATIYHGDIYISKEILNEEESAKQFLEHALPRVAIDKTTEDEVDLEGTIYKHFNFSGTLDNEKVMVVQQGSQVQFHFDTTKLGDFRSYLNLDVTGENKSLSSLADFGVKAILHIQMPGDIIRTNVGTFQGTTAEIDLLNLTISKISIVSSTQQKNEKIGLALAGVIFLSFFGYYEVKKQKANR